MQVIQGTPDNTRVLYRLQTPYIHHTRADAIGGLDFVLPYKEGCIKFPAGGHDTLLHLTKQMFYKLGLDIYGGWWYDN